MKNFLQALFFITILNFFAFYEKSFATQAPHLLLLSNSTLQPGKYLEYAKDIIQIFFKSSSEKGVKVLFIPYAEVPKNQTKPWPIEWENYTKKARNTLQPLGIDIISANSTDFKKLLSGVDGIFIGGGNTFHLLHHLNKTGLFKEIQKKVQEGMPYMGSSAGTIVSTATIRTTNDMCSVPLTPTTTMEGLNLFPFLINAHYISGTTYHKNNANEYALHNGETRAQRLTEFLNLNSQYGSTVIGLPEGIILEQHGTEVKVLSSSSLGAPSPCIYLLTRQDGNTDLDIKLVSQPFELKGYSFIF